MHWHYVLEMGLALKKISGQFRDWPKARALLKNLSLALDGPQNKSPNFLGHSNTVKPEPGLGLGPSQNFDARLGS